MYKKQPIRNHLTLIHDKKEMLSQKKRNIGERPQLDKHLQKPTVNIVLNGEKVDGFPLRLGTRQIVPSCLFFDLY